MKNLKKLACAVMFSGLVGVVQASTVSLSPSSQSVVLGQDVSFDVNVNFTETTSKGRFDLSYDASILSFSSFSYDPAFTSPVPVDSTTLGLIKNIGFTGSKSGPGLLGTITFSTLDTGTAFLTAPAPSTFGFRNSADTGFISVTYSGAEAQVSAVPVPAAMWLMASGLLGMVGLSRRT